MPYRQGGYLKQREIQELVLFDMHLSLSSHSRSARLFRSVLPFFLHFNLISATLQTTLPLWFLVI